MPTPASSLPWTWKRAGIVIAVLAPGAALTAATSCSSSGSHPGELATADSGEDHSLVDTYHDTAPAPEPTPETGPGDASDAEAGCVPTGDAGTVVSPTSLSFGKNADGLVPCGTQAQALQVTITNDTCAAFTYNASLTSGSNFYALSPNTGQVVPGATQTVQVVPNPMPQTSDVTPDLYEGTINITTTSPGDTGHIVQLHETANGAIIKSTQFGQTLSFGGVAIGNTASSQFSVTNTGNASASVSFAVGSQFFTVSPSFTIDANKGVAPQVTFKPTNVQPYTDTITTSVAAGTPLCASPPPTTSVTGSGTNGIGVSPTNFDFGIVQCGAPAAAFQTTTISNTGSATTFSLSLAKGTGSPYTLADSAGTAIAQGASNNLAAASSATIRIVPKAITSPADTGSDAFADTLTITTTSPSDVPHNVGLHQTAQGAVFAMPSTITASTGQNTTTFQNFNVSNNGNLGASYTLTVVTTKGPAGTFSSNLLGGNLGAGKSEPGVLTCTAQSDGEGGTQQDLGTLTLTPAAGAVLCADVPPATQLSLTVTP
jgi:hypothetical protein